MARKNYLLGLLALVSFFTQTVWAAPFNGTPITPYNNNPPNRTTPMITTPSYSVQPRVLTVPLACQPDFLTQAWRNASTDFEWKQRLLGLGSRTPQPAHVDPVTELRNRLNSDPRITESRRTNCNNFLTAVVPDVHCHAMTMADLQDAILNRNTFNLFDPGSNAEYTACKAIFYGYITDYDSEQIREAENRDADLNPLSPEDMAFVQNASLLDLARNIVKAEKALCECLPNPSSRPQGLHCE